MSYSVGQHTTFEGHPARDFNTHRCSFITTFSFFSLSPKLLAGFTARNQMMNFVLQVQNGHVHTGSTRHCSNVILQTWTSSASHL